MGNAEIEREVQTLCDRRGIDIRVNHDTRLADIGLGSLDVSELAIRVEEQLGRELKLGGAVLRKLDTVDDLVLYLRSAVDVS